VIIDGFVIDVEGWVNFHPGGRFAILDRLGTDVSDVFRGHSESAHGKHRHSAGARSKMRKLRIARYLALDDDKSAERRLEAVGELHAFTWDQIQKETDSGALWIVIEGFILDVSSFFHAHPGGGRVLLSYVCQKGVFVARIVFLYW
jgi:cytochrome b involved in lipid metabolism